MKLAHNRGVSLIEALVALAVMAFGMLGVVGMQATLRFNGDLSKQRSEAVRLAQERLEQLRSFGTLPTTPGQIAFADIAPEAASAAALPGSANASYQREVLVPTEAASAPALRQVTVNVSWLDRRAGVGIDPQSVTLSTMVAGIAPELGAALALSGNHTAPQRPRERHPAVPPSAVNQDNGTSNFTPPNSGGFVWVFNNQTGLVISVCNPVGSCVATNAWLLSGYINFANDAGTPPTEAEAKVPAGSVPTGTNWDVAVDVTLPLSTPTVTCFDSADTVRISYFCLVPTTFTAAGRAWSGQSRLVLSGGSGVISTTAADATPGNFKVCRYTLDPSTDTPAGGNGTHPLNYTLVNQPLANQNFLVIAAGSGGLAHECPTDSSGSLVNSNTRRHQPA